MNKKDSLILTLILCVIPMIVGIILIGRLPDQIPVQWGSGGDVSSSAPKLFVVFGLPIFFIIMDLYLYFKAEKSDLSVRYPENMKIFLKWSMPILSVVTVGISYASVLGGSMLYVSLAGFIGSILVILGSYFSRFVNVNEIRKIYFICDEYAEKVYSLCGLLFVAFGIVSAFLAVLGLYKWSFASSAAAFIVTFICTKGYKKG